MKVGLSEQFPDWLVLVSVNLNANGLQGPTPLSYLCERPIWCSYGSYGHQEVLCEDWKYNGLEITYVVMWRYVNKDELNGMCHKSYSKHYVNYKGVDEK